MGFVATRLSGNLQVETPLDPAGDIQIVGSNIRFAEEVTPDDDVDLDGVALYGAAQMIYLGLGGDVVIASTGADLTFTDMTSGVWHPMPPFTRIKEASTATGIIAGY